LRVEAGKVEPGDHFFEVPFADATVEAATAQSRLSHVSITNLGSLGGYRERKQEE